VFGGLSAIPASWVMLRGPEDANLRLLIRDDGIGGADAAKGSGLVDRVEALGGTMAIASHPRGGTSLVVNFPLDTQ
jgi:signal transduction histidine kinase